MEHFYQVVGEDWFTYPVLYRSMVGSATDGAHFVEVGSWKGRSASFMGVEILNSGKKIRFDCVDTWVGSAEHNGLVPALRSDKDALYKMFISNVAPLGNAINPIRSDSVSASKLYNDCELDFVFIDAAHDYDSVRSDIEHWLPKVKVGGFLAGHDYGIHPGVKKAVDEIFLINKIKIAEKCWIYQKGDK